jgi:hypothetical protein
MSIAGLRSKTRSSSSGSVIRYRFDALDPMVRVSLLKVLDAVIHVDTLSHSCQKELVWVGLG